MLLLIVITVPVLFPLEIVLAPLQNTSLGPNELDREMSAIAVTINTPAFS